MHLFFRHAQTHTHMSSKIFIYCVNVKEKDKLGLHTNHSCRRRKYDLRERT